MVVGVHVAETFGKACVPHFEELWLKYQVVVQGF